MQILKLALIIMGCSSLSCWAFEALPDSEMSDTVAQDGLTVMWQMADQGIRMDALALVDKNGISNTITPNYNNAGRLIARNVGIKTCVESTINSSCTPSSLPTLRFDSDVIGDHNGNGISSPMLNIAFSLMGGANKIRFYIDKIALSNGAGNNERTIIDFGGRTGNDIDPDGDYIDIVPIGSKTLLNMQFGFEEQGNLVKFVNGNFGTIDFGVVSFIEAQNNANSLRFGFKLDQFDITDMGIDIGPKGLVFSSADFGKGNMDITFSDIKMGGASAASVGTIGIQDIKVTNLLLTIAGKS